MPAPVISVAQMREWEQATWKTGRSEAEVINQVGRVVARRALELTRPGGIILILAGKGHNGDDARMAEPHLTDRHVHVIEAADPRVAAHELNKLLISSPDLIIDGLFGIGLNRPLSEDWTGLIDQINQSRVPVLAVDVPSGLAADTGEAFGAAVRATVTLTLAAPKRGLLDPRAVPFVGRLEVAPDIGLVSCPLSSGLSWTLPDDFKGYPPARPVDSHKGTFGHLVILAGSLGYHGAAVLATRAALRAKPGLVTLLTQQDVYAPVASQLQSAMVRPWRAASPLPDSCTAFLVGPGLADADLSAELKSEVRYLWEHAPLPVIVDASALDWLPAGATLTEAARVITPHPGEAARMLGTTTAKVQQQRSKTVSELSRRFGKSWVVLKGHQTCIGRDVGAVFINPTGNPGLAQGGTGDVLAGYVGGLLAQPTLQADPLLAIRYGVWQHGAAADRLERLKPNWTSEDLLNGLGLDNTCPS
jgi:NAD(P)H-hydrate epimerase